MKKILFLTSYPIWRLLEKEVDLIKQLQNKKNKIVLFNCDGNVNFCSANTFQFKKFDKIDLICKVCISRKNFASKYLKKDNVIFENYLNLQDLQKEKISNILNIISKNFKDSKIKELLDNIDPDLNSSILSTLGSMWQDNIVSYESDKKKLILKLVENALQSYYSSKNIFNKYKFDKVYLFNGRITKYQPFLREAQKKINKNNIFVFEYPVDSHNGVYLVKKNMPHDTLNSSNQISKLIKKNKSNTSKIKSYAKKYLDNIISNKAHLVKNTSWKDKQSKNFLPKNFENKKIISFFLSSEYEYSSVKEAVNNSFFFLNQKILISKLIPIINKIKKDIYFIIRIHPNSGRYKKKLYEDFKKLRKKNVYIVDADNKLNSHFLVKKSLINFTFGSTMAMSSVYQSKYTIDLGNNYIPYDICFTPSSLYKTIVVLKKILNKQININHVRKKENLFKFIYFRRFMNTQNIYSIHNNGKDYLIFEKQRIKVNGDKVYEFFYFILKCFGYIFPYFKGTLNKN